MTKYTCPMHPEVISDKPGECPKCAMALVKKDDQTRVKPSKLSVYQPLIIIIGIIALATLLLAVKEIESNTFTLRDAMSNFMAGFFLVFAGAKLLDLRGFARAYYSYDLLARRFFTYGYIYPYYF